MVIDSSKVILGETIYDGDFARVGGILYRGVLNGLCVGEAWQVLSKGRDC